MVAANENIENLTNSSALVPNLRNKGHDLGRNRSVAMVSVSQYKPLKFLLLHHIVSDWALLNPL